MRELVSFLWALQCEDTRWQQSATWTRVLPRTWLCWPSDRGLPAYRTVRSKFLLFTSHLYEHLVAQSCPTPCDPLDCSPPGSSVHEIFQEYWSGLPCPPPGDLPNSEIEPMSLVSTTLQVDSLPTEPLRIPSKIVEEAMKNKRIRTIGYCSEMCLASYEDLSEP